MSDEFQTEYQAYRERVSHKLGGDQVGAYHKHSGRLVKTLSHDEFVVRWREYRQAREAYDRILAEGDTVNDAIVQLLDERSAELLLDE